MEWPCSSKVLYIITTK